jgi:anti-sigma B factor antagonist
MLADVRFENADDLLIARIAGEVDMSNADEIGSALKQMMSNQAIGLVVDLSNVDYFDSAGIHLVYDLRESLRVRGQQLRLVVPDHSATRDALSLAGVLQALEVDPTVEQAIGMLNGRG